MIGSPDCPPARIASHYRPSSSAEEGTTTGTAEPIPEARQCDPNDGSKDELQRDVDDSVCKEMADADIAHENSHWKKCNSDGFKKYWYGTTGSARALEESRAYEAEAKVLKEVLKKLCDRCKPHRARSSSGCAAMWPSERLALTSSGQVRYTLKTPYRDGTPTSCWSHWI